MFAHFGVEAVGGNEGAAGDFVDEEFVAFLVTLADAGDVAGKGEGDGVAAVEVFGEGSAVAGDAVAEFIKGGEVFDDAIDLGGVEGVAVAEAGEGDVFGAELEEDAVELLVVVDVLLPFLALDFVERRLGDVDVATLEEAFHLAVEEGEQQGADVGAVHIGIGHDDDFVVAGFLDVEAADGVAAFADAGADGGDEGADFLVGEDLVEAGFLGVDKFAAQGEDGLVAAVAALFGGAAGGVALDDVDFGFGGVAGGAIGEFAGEAAAGEGAFADGFAGFAGGFASAGGVE